MKVDRDLIEAAVVAVEPELEFESLLRESYRGKGETQEGFGLVYPAQRWITGFFVQLAIIDSVAATSLVRASKHDQMGRGFITYWPGWELTAV